MGRFCGALPGGSELDIRGGAYMKLLRAQGGLVGVVGVLAPLEKMGPGALDISGLAPFFSIGTFP